MKSVLDTCFLQQRLSSDRGDHVQQRNSPNRLTHISFTLCSENLVINRTTASCNIAVVFHGFDVVLHAHVFSHRDALEFNRSRISINKTFGLHSLLPYQKIHIRIFYCTPKQIEFTSRVVLLHGRNSRRLNMRNKSR